MKLFEVIGSVLVFLLLLVSYFAVFRSLVQGAFLPLGMAKAVHDRIRKRNVAGREYAVMAGMETASVMLLAALLAVLLLITSMSQQSWYAFWQSPVVLAVYLMVSVHATGQLKAYNPILRPVAVFWLYQTWPVILSVFLGAMFPQAFAPAIAKWAGLAAASALFLLGFPALKAAPRSIRLFEELDARHDVLGDKIRRLRHVVDVLRDMQEWAGVRDAFRNADAQYDAAFSRLRRGALQNAEAALLQGEAEVEGLERLVRDRIRLSLRDELDSRLQQAIDDCETLKREFEAAGLPSTGIDKIIERAAAQRTELPTVEFDVDNVGAALEPFEALLAEVVTARTALRLRSNVDASLDGLRAEITDTDRHVSVSDALGLDVDHAVTARNALKSRVAAFSAEGIDSVEGLIKEYRQLREAASSHRAAVDALVAGTKRLYSILQIPDQNAALFVPTRLTTHEATAGALLVTRKGSEPCNPMLCELDGVMLEMEERRSFTVTCSPSATFAVVSFSLVGKRGGTGKLTARLKTTQGEDLQSVMAPVSIAPPGSEIAKNALIFAAPSGGIAILLLWYFLRDIAIAVPVGAGIGGAVSLLLFLLRRLRASRK